MGSRFATKRARDRWHALDYDRRGDVVRWWRDRLAGDARDLLDAELVDGVERHFVDAEACRRVYASVYVRELNWGGPEEGGWYYDTYRLDDEAPAFESPNTTDGVADAVRQATEWTVENAPRYGYSSVLGGWDYQVIVETRRGANTDVDRQRWS